MIGPIDLKKLSWLYEQNHIEKTNNNCYAYQCARVIYIYFDGLNEKQKK